MNIGVVCYASIGGSGIVATELGKALASRGHRVHVLSSEMPARFGDYQPRMFFHRVETPSYPLFREPQYALSLANKIVQVSQSERLDLVHAHYAIPHATAAYLARQVLAATPGAVVPRIITTLHGTDITLVGADRSYSDIVAFSIEESDGVTTVSDSLKRDTYRELGCTCDIRVIPNFVDCEKNRRRFDPDLRASLAPRGEKLLIHVSNFRPVKRLPVTVDVLARVRREVPARLLLVGDGPDIGEALRLARTLDIADDVLFLGEQDFVVPLLSVADVFLLPSLQESFGLAALEAMACGVPVVAARVGGVPELVEDGVTGCLHALDDVDGMARSVVAMLTNEDMHARMADAGVRTAHEKFCEDDIVPVYETFYREILQRNGSGAKPADR